MNYKVINLILLISTFNITAAGPLAAGTCYAGCGALVTACFLAAGFIFGTVPGAQIAGIPALVKCNVAFAVCEKACIAALLAPTA